MTSAQYDEQAIQTFEDDPSLEQTHRNMAESGHRVEDVVEINYFGFSSTERWYFPGQSRIPDDRKQYLVVKKMSEGDKARFQKTTNRDIRIQRTTGDARMSMDAVAERHELIRISVTDARVMMPGPDGKLRFDDKKVEVVVKNLLDNGDPDVVQQLEKFIRELNPWMRADMSVEEIDKEIERLQEIKREKADEEAGN